VFLAETDLDFADPLSMVPDLGLSLVQSMAHDSGVLGLVGPDQHQSWCQIERSDWSNSLIRDSGSHASTLVTHAGQKTGSPLPLTRARARG
jgi:hypothetical protein